MLSIVLQRSTRAPALRRSPATVGAEDRAQGASWAVAAWAATGVAKFNATVLTGRRRVAQTDAAAASVEATVNPLAHLEAKLDEVLARLERLDSARKD